MEDDVLDTTITSGISGTTTPNSGRSTPASKRKLGPAPSRSEAVLEQALDALQNCQEDDAQIFGNFIASSIRELDTLPKQQALKRALNRTLLDFQDDQHRQAYPTTYQPAYQVNPTSASSSLHLPPFTSITQNMGVSDAYGSQTYHNL